MHKLNTKPSPTGTLNYAWERKCDLLQIKLLERMKLISLGNLLKLSLGQVINQIKWVRALCYKVIEIKIRMEKRMRT
jgi:hypothetical protein